MRNLSKRRARSQKLDRSIAILRQRMPELAACYRVRSLGIFGSYVRNEQTRRSDIDILVDYAKTPNLFEFMDLEEYLASLLDAKVDLVSRWALKGNVGKRILNEVVMI